MDRSEYREDYIGDVIRIVSSSTILVNAGVDKIGVGDIVQVYEPGETIYDIDKNEIGKYDNIKDTLEVIRVEKTFAECKKVVGEPLLSESPFPGLAFSPLLSRRRTTLNVKAEDIEPLQPIDDPVIHIGDPVRKIG